jgi:DNA-directed RNA polymerase specialized sigma24 family protein
VGTLEHFDAADARERDYVAFVSAVDSRLRHALVARFGGERGSEAYCEALAYAWQHWERVRGMENPLAYLFTVGRSRTRRLVPRRVSFPVAEPGTVERQIEPKLARALERISSRQRTAVVLVVAFGWSYSEVADVMRVTKSTVQRHVDRAMVALRRDLGVEDADER